MTGLWTNDRDTLADACGVCTCTPGPGYDGPEEDCPLHGKPEFRARYLIETGAVRTLDPDDTELVGQLADAIQAELQRPHSTVAAGYRAAARRCVVKLRQP
jgi:hypothetical protein